MAASAYQYQWLAYQWRKRKLSNNQCRNGEAAAKPAAASKRGISCGEENVNVSKEI
jgi:hypothetical protein